MKSYREFLIESQKTYDFRIKVAGEVSNDQLESMENMLEKFGLESLSKPKRTPIQEHPQDFPDIVNSEVSIMELVVNYPATPRDVKEAICACTQLPESHVRVYNANDPLESDREIEVAQEEQEYEVQLTAPYPKSKSELFGDKYNKNFLKGLKSVFKTKAAGGNTPKAQTSNDLPQGKASPVGSNKVNMPTVKSSAR